MGEESDRYDLDTIDGWILVERGGHYGEADERQSHNGETVEDGFDDANVVQVLGVGEEINHSLVGQAEEGESSLFLFLFHDNMANEAMSLGLTTNIQLLTILM